MPVFFFVFRCTELRKIVKKETEKERGSERESVCVWVDDREIEKDRYMERKTRKYKYRNAIRQQKSKLTVFLVISTAAYIGSSSSPWKNTQCSICVTSCRPLLMCNTRYTQQRTSCRPLLMCNTRYTQQLTSCRPLLMCNTRYTQQLTSCRPLLESYVQTSGGTPSMFLLGSF